MQDRDGPFAGVTLKQREYEEAMCAELGLLCGAFLIARAKWNQSAGNDTCIARISEVCAAYGTDPLTEAILRFACSCP